MHLKKINALLYIEDSIARIIIKYSTLLINQETIMPTIMKVVHVVYIFINLV